MGSFAQFMSRSRDDRTNTQRPRTDPRPSLGNADGRHDPASPAETLGQPKVEVAETR